MTRKAAIALVIITQALVIGSGHTRAPRGNAAIIASPTQASWLAADSACVCSANFNAYEHEQRRKACYWDVGEDLSWQMERLRETLR